MAQGVLCLIWFLRVFSVFDDVLWVLSVLWVHFKVFSAVPGRPHVLMKAGGKCPVSSGIDYCFPAFTMNGFCVGDPLFGP